MLATHDLELAALCDRVVLLRDGRVLAAGPASDVLTPDELARTFGVRVRCIDDPSGVRMFRLLGADAVGP